MKGQSTNTIKIAIAGSSQNSLTCAQTIAADKRFQISWTLTPQPKAIGRKQKIVKNPLQNFAEEKNIPVINVVKKIDQELKTKIQKQCLVAKKKNKKLSSATLKDKIFSSHSSELDLLLVVDFGYLIPNWLLELPKIAPLNIHPSDLPKWRGSSPGQFVLLTAEKQSAICLIKMNEQLDQGPIIYKKTFTVQKNWTQTEYYQAAFKLINQNLAQVIFDFSKQKIKAQAQPTNSPTPIARRLTKDDSFISWEKLKIYLAKTKPSFLSKEKIKIDQIKELNLSRQKRKMPLLKTWLQKNPSLEIIEQACRAFQPWPVLWTIIPTTKGPKRMKIWQCHCKEETLVLDEVQIEGKNKASWHEVKNVLRD
ncbi:MAG: formyltransferase family protein [Candidatus Woesebacteria bacterium]|jgi:methionyl-tRNA formyltransferase